MPNGLHEALDEDAVEELRERLYDTHKFHIINPAHTEAVAYSLWRQGDDYEFPIVENTGGMMLFNDVRRGSGEGAVQPSDKFFDIIAYTYHQHVCVHMPMMDPVEETWDEIAEMFETPIRDHEKWAGVFIVAEVLSAYHEDKEIRPTIAPIRHYIDCCTEWGVPEVESSDRGFGRAGYDNKS